MLVKVCSADHLGRSSKRPWGSEWVGPGICIFSSSPSPGNDNFLKLVIIGTDNAMNHSRLLSTGQSTKIRYYSPFTCLSRPFPGAPSVVVVAYSQSALWLQKSQWRFWLCGYERGFTEEMILICVFMFEQEFASQRMVWEGDIPRRRNGMCNDYVYKCSRKTESSNVLGG